MGLKFFCREGCQLLGEEKGGWTHPSGEGPAQRPGLAAAWWDISPCLHSMRPPPVLPLSVPEPSTVKPLEQLSNPHSKILIGAQSQERDGGSVRRGGWGLLAEGLGSGVHPH